MPTRLVLNIRPEDREPVLAALRARGDEARRTLSNPQVGEREQVEARAADLRSRILERAVREPGLITKTIAARLKCSVHIVRQTIRNYNDRGLAALTPGRAGRERDELGEKQTVQELKLLAEQEPDAGPAELARQLGLSRSRFYHYSRLANLRFRPRYRPKSC